MSVFIIMDEYVSFIEIYPNSTRMTSLIIITEAVFFSITIVQSHAIDGYVRHDLIFAKEERTL